MESVVQDVRFAARMLAKSPGFTLAAVLCIALGIGVDTTIFSTVNAILLRPLPFPDPERIVVLHGTQVKYDIDDSSLSYPEYRDYVEQSKSYSALAAYTGRSLTLAGRDEPERVQGVQVSAGLFPMLGVKPVLGRTFREDEDRPGAAGTVMLSHGLWLRRFGGDPGIVGQSIQVNAAPHVVIGVMPPGFEFPEHQQAWIALAPSEHAQPRTERNLAVMARLKPGVTVEQARAETGAIAERLAKQYPETNAGWSATAISLRREFVGEHMKLILLTMMGAVTFVLLIACANVANLLLARATARQREVAIRAAFGAGRGRIVRQLLIESVLLGLGGAALGILLAIFGIRLIEMGIPPQELPPYWIRFTIDGTVLAFTFAVAVATGIAFGLAPALQATRADLHETLKEGGRGAGGSVRRNRLRNALVVAEVALSLVLLVGASLFVRSFLALQRADGGFDPRHLLTLRIYLPGEAYEEPAAKARRVEDIVRRLEALPGVLAATASNTIPLGGGGSGGAVLLDDRAFPRGEEPVVFWTGVTSHFFETLGVPLAAGRAFDDREGAERTPVAVVDRAFAKKFWPKGGALGHRFRLKDEPDAAWVTIVGVVPDIKSDDLDDEPQMSAYLPYPWLATPNTGFTIRTRFDPAQVAPAARREIRAADPGLPVFDVATMEEVRRLGFWEFHLFGWMFSVFGGIALALAAIGVYGVLSYAVSQRLREIGVRVALGAQRGQVLRLVVGQGLGLAVLGVALGLAGAFGVTRVLADILWGISATDPPSFAAVPLLLTAVAFVASYLPARRATEVDPLVALRAE